MKKLLITAFILGSVLTGCATAPGMSEQDISQLRSGVKTVTFLQDGLEPYAYGIGSVDGKTFWARAGGVQFTPASANQADQKAATEANLVVAVGSAIAKNQLSNEPQHYPKLVKAMVGERKFTSQIAPQVFPLMADAWGVPYAADKVIVNQESQVAVNDKGEFIGKDPGTDLVLVYGINSMRVDEVVGVARALINSFKLGMGSRNVTSFLQGRMHAFKRQPDGRLAKVWSGECSDAHFINADVSESFDVMAEHPEKAKPVFDAAIPIAVKSCSYELAKLKQKA